MVTLPKRPPPTPTSDETGETEGSGLAISKGATPNPRPSLSSVHDAIDHNLITFDT